MGADRPVRFETVQRRGELGNQCRVQGIQRRRPVERDDANRAAPLDEDVLVILLLAHPCLSSAAVSHSKR